MLLDYGSLYVLMPLRYGKCLSMELNMVVVVVVVVFLKANRLQWS
jgi:hypothetical protein